MSILLGIQELKKHSSDIIKNNGWEDNDFNTDSREYEEGYLKALEDVKNLLNIKTYVVTVKSKYIQSTKAFIESKRLYHYDNNLKKWISNDDNKPENVFYSEDSLIRCWKNIDNEMILLIYEASNIMELKKEISRKYPNIDHEVLNIYEL